MRSLPERLPDVDRRLVTRIAPDPYARVDSNEYSLDPGLVGRRVELRVSPRSSPSRATATASASASATATSAAAHPAATPRPERQPVAPTARSAAEALSTRRSEPQSA